MAKTGSGSYGIRRRRRMGNNRSGVHPDTVSELRSVSKFHNKKILVDGIMFDSAKEAARYCELLLLKHTGEITDLERQVPFELIPSQKDAKGKVIERKMTYIADFVYKDKDGKRVVEDVKGMRTEVYKLKRKLMLYVHGIQIREV